MQNEDYVGIYPSKQSWHIEPFGKYTKRCLLEMLPETFYSYGVMCGDGESHDLLPVNEECAKEFGAMGKGDVKLSFRIWHRNGQGKIVLWRSYHYHAMPVKRHDPAVVSIVGVRKPASQVHKRLAGRRVRSSPEDVM